jgi:SAM-dependent methyltransferase
VDENQRFYERRFTGAHYAGQSELQPDEAAILDRYGSELAGVRILDLGVGGGRTTPFLLELSSDYVGVDYSSEMIARCRRRFPGVSFQVADARDLSPFPDECFDFVFFSNNGIDSVDHDDRLRVFGEVHRVLKQGAIFVFSSHNRNFRNPKPWDFQHLAINPLRNPVRFGKRLVSYPLGIFNYVRHAQRNQVEDEYSILIDSAHRYSLLHYRITIAAQQAQLQRSGFDFVEVVGFDGRSLQTCVSETAQDPWIQYVSRKAR